MAKEKSTNWFVRHKVLSVILAFVVIAVISSAAGGDNKSNSSGSKSSSSKTATAAKVGEAANDGKFEFTVKSIECGKTSVGSQYLTKEAQGQFCLLSVTVKNIGDQAQSLFSTNQKLLNAQGQQYAADDTATIYAAPNGSSWYSNINPGNSVEGTIVFDIPKGQTVVTAELHDSALSSGVKVSL